MNPHKAHAHSAAHRNDVENSDQCGCFYCLSTFSPDEIEEWIEDDEGDTALCPRCGVDSVLPGSVDDQFVQTPFLEEMNATWY